VAARISEVAEARVAGNFQSCMSLLAVSAVSPSRWKVSTTPRCMEHVWICSFRTLLCVKCTHDDEDLSFPDYSVTQNNISEINILKQIFI
jgi:hypothetical protein